jgi:5-methylthioadenosine/S-adenosylhomocysteine deaminase
MEQQIGSLEAGKHADVITVSITGARQTPLYDPISHLVYVARGDDVVTSIVHGKTLMRNRKVATLNEARVLSDARAWADRVRAAVRQGTR